MKEVLKANMKKDSAKKIFEIANKDGKVNITTIYIGDGLNWLYEEGYATLVKIDASKQNSEIITVTTHRAEDTFDENSF